MSIKGYDDYMDLVGRFDSKGIRWCIFVKVLSQVKDILYCNLYIGRNEQYIIAIYCQ